MEMQPTTAVIYASKTGKTRKVAQYVASKLGADIFDLKKQTMIDMKGYKRIVFGTGIHFGKPYDSVVKFLETNKEELAKKKVSLFISCMSTEEKGETQTATVSESLGIKDVFYLDSKKEKNEDGFDAGIDGFIARQRV